LCVSVAGGILGLTSRSDEFASGWSRLLSYHGGVLAVGGAFAIVLWVVIGPFRSKSWYQERLVLPLSFGVAGMTFFWLAALFLPGM
jgi:hypothetical protein